ncbi:DinB family protein [Paenibacillus sp. KQZ6P-2]|uniref:DinB family protein n=1 Tax=Paenibacillus mangrovi TaxID=2931978 RepID=A0A9X1WS76_9BACL|nr:DinB family protein [Paenibacillus mangrovi]MCJ8014048.1 DinB family protein [Paenibacillus mangrovi]
MMSHNEELWAGLSRHREVLIQLTELVDDEHIHFKPWEGAMTLGELVVHIATSLDMFLNLVITGNFAPPAKPEFAGIDDIRRIVEEYTAKSKAEILSLTPEQLSGLVDFNRKKLPGESLLQLCKDHEVHHKGQLFTYLRIIGIEKLPFFIQPV